MIETKIKQIDKKDKIRKGQLNVQWITGGCCYWLWNYGLHLHVSVGLSIYVPGNNLSVIS